GPAYQDSVLTRSDAKAFVTDPLPDAVRIRGAISVALDLATTGDDTNVAVRLTDVDPQGRHLMIAHGAARLMLRNGMTRQSVIPGQRYSLEIPMTSDLAYTLAAGHRLGLIVSGSNSILFAVNPHTGADFVAPNE